MYAAYICMAYMNYKKYIEYKKIKKIKNNIVTEMINKKEFDIIIDIRSEKEYDKKHIPESILFNKYKIKELYSKINKKESKILVYSNKGENCFRFCQSLINNGYKNVYFIDDDIIKLEI